MLFRWRQLVLNMPHIGASDRFSLSMGAALRGFVAGGLILMAACSVLDSASLIKLDMPVATTVSWQTETKYCQEPALTSPVILESLLQEVPAGCEWLPTFNPVTQALQPFCRASGQCERLYTIGSRSLAIPVITENARYTDVAAAQQQILELTRKYSALRVNTFGGIDHLIKRGLQAFQHTGINPFTMAVLAAEDSGLVSGVWLADDDLLSAVKHGQTYVSVDEYSSLRLSASFDDLNCEQSSAAYNVLDIAPEQVKQLNFVNRIRYDLGEGSAYIVKHWLDLSGRLKRRTIAVNIQEECSIAADSQFDGAYASAYFLVIKNTVASTPIWYLPPRG